MKKRVVYLTILFLLVIGSIFLFNKNKSVSAQSLFRIDECSAVSTGVQECKIYLDIPEGVTYNSISMKIVNSLVERIELRPDFYFYHVEGSFQDDGEVVNYYYRYQNGDGFHGRIGNIDTHTLNNSPYGEWNGSALDYRGYGNFLNGTTFEGYAYAGITIEHDGITHDNIFNTLESCNSVAQLDGRTCAKVQFDLSDISDFEFLKPNTLTWTNDNSRSVNLDVFYGKTMTDTTAYIGDIVFKGQLTMGLVDSSNALSLINNDSVLNPAKVESFKLLDDTETISYVKPGDEFYYRITIKNPSLYISNNITVVDQVPSELTILEAADGSIDTTNNRVTWTHGYLTAGETLTLNIKVKAKDNNSDNIKEITNNVSVQNGSKSKEFNNKITIAKPITITSTNNTTDNKIYYNDDVNSSITIRNNTSQELKRILVTYCYDTEAFEPNNEASVVDNCIRKSINTLSAESEQTVSVNLKVKSGFHSKEAVNNIYVYDLSSFGGNNLNNDSGLHGGKEIDTGSITNFDDYLIAQSVDRFIVQGRRPEANLLLNLAVSKNIVKPEEQFNYTITVSNNGEGASDNIVLTDEYDDNKLVVINANGGNHSGNKVTWEFGSIEPGETITKTITVSSIIDGGINFRNKETGEGTTISNSAYIDNNQLRKTVQNIIDEPDVRLKGDIYDLNNNSITSVEANKEYIFKLTAENVSSVSTAADTYITYTFDNLFDIIESDGGQVENNVITWTTGTIEPSGKVIKNVKVKLKDSTTIGNASSTHNTIYAKYGVYHEQLDVDVIIFKGLELTKSVNKEFVQAGDEVEYTISIKNLTSEPLLNVEIVDEIQNAKFIHIDEGDDVELDSTPNNNRVTLSYSLSANAIKIIKLKAQVNASVNVNDYVTESTTLSYNGKNTTNTNKLLVKGTLLEGSINSSVDKVMKGDEFTYEISVKNSGNVSANNFQVIDIIDDGLEVISCDSCSQSNNTLTWNVSELESNSTKKYLVKVKANNLGSKSKINNTLKIMEGSNNVLHATNKELNVVAYKLSLTTSVKSEKVNPGQEFTYTIRVKNLAGVEVKNVHLIQELNDNFEIVDSKGGKINGGINWNFDLKANEEKVITVKYNVKKDSKIGITKINTRLIDSDNNTSNSELNIEITKAVLNPNTGSFVNYSLIICGISIALFLVIKSKKDKKIFGV